MDPKSTVVKSKSSNSAISKKSKEDTRRQYNKKTRSNANLPPHSLKKRGVYVEKRSTKINLLKNDEEVDSGKQKPPPRPRAGQKNFLTSVLNILSKSTAGTQYPDIEEDCREYKYRENKKNKAYLRGKTINKDTVSDVKNTKGKFKSRVLEKKFVREDKKKMVVLQSKKEIALTPSNYSDWSYKDASEVSNESNSMVDDDANSEGRSNTAEELKDAVLEGRNVKVKELRYLEDETQTLVSDKDSKDKKNLYNFFVDLLETTISVYNVKAEYDVTDPSDASRTNLQINDSVATKLNVGKGKTTEYDDGIVTPQFLFDLQNEANHESNFVGINPKPSTIKHIKREESSKPGKAKKLHTDSFVYTNNFKKIPQKSKSVEISRKTMFKKKSDLINALKQELELRPTFEEPRSIFQALKVMARNKKKITFDSSVEYHTLTDECDLKRRKVISSRKFKKNNKDNARNTSKPAKTVLNCTDYIQNPKMTHTDIDGRDSSERDETESNHSLEVYGFDYEPKSRIVNETYFSKTKDFTLVYHSSSSNSEFDFDVQDAILNPTSTLSSITKVWKS